MKTLKAITDPPETNRCKCHYRPRWFYSKGAFLVLLWIFLTNIGAAICVYILLHYYKYPMEFRAVPVIVGLLGCVLSGWLADAKLGNYKVIQLANALLFIAETIVCAYFLASKSLQNVYIAYFMVCLFSMGLAASIVTSLQLGLDQMPEASSSSITAFIAWYVFSAFFGVWIGDIVINFFESCLREYKVFDLTNSIQILSILPPLCSAIILVSDFLLGKKWLIIEPKSPQLLKTIYQVLKFAWKHKAPLNRSALTYWEEDVPSRMDLGKSRYGGPFTTEQVEDVKIIFRLLTLSIPLYFICFPIVSKNPQPEKIKLPGSSNCTYHLISSVTYDYWWYAMLCILTNEFIIYPLLRNKLPSILRRVTIVSLASAILYTTVFIFRLLQYLHKIQDIATTILYVQLIFDSVLLPMLISAILELVCAQTPYKMRGLLTGYTNVLVLFCRVLQLYSKTLISDPTVTVVLAIFGAKAVSSVIGFVLFCLLARWYKKRVRDEEYNVHRVVEEVYDRYLSAQN